MVDYLITLFEHDEREFRTNGLGSLNEAISCTVLEERNGEFELSMEYPATGRHFQDLVRDRIIFAKPDPYRDPQPFRIYDISKPINGVIAVSAHHISYDLSGYPIAPFTASTLSFTMEELNKQMSRAFNKNKPPFHFSHKKDEVTTEMRLVAPCSARALLGGSEGTILDIYRGEYEWDRWNVILHNKRGNNNGVRIAYGKNLTDLEQEENCENVWTGVYPFWYYEDEETGATLVELSEDDEGKILYCDGTYNHERIMILDLSAEFQDPPTPEQLGVKALDYIQENQIGSPKVNLSVSFLNLADTTTYSKIQILEKVSLCDTVIVEFPEMDVYSTSTVISTKYNVLMNKYVEIQLGEPKSDLASTIANQSTDIQKKVNDQRSALQRAIDSATKLITGGLGGYVILHSSDPNSKYPDEILIMDTPDINTAVHVWRWNSAGLGYSENGYDGPFELAMTMDGSIVASFITSGVLNGALIKAGSITAEALSVEYRDAVTKEIEAAVLESEKAMRKELIDLGLASGDINEELHSVVKDNIITEAEKRSIQKMLQQLEKEKLEADTAYRDLYAALSEGSAVKVGLQEKKLALDIAYTNLVSSINTVLEQTTADGITTAVANYNTVYDKYKTAYDEYEQALQLGYDTNYSVKLDVTREGIMASVTEVQNTLTDAITASENSLKNELIDLGLAGGSINEGLYAIVEDNIITEAEKRSIQKMVQQLEKEKAEVDTAYEDLYKILPSSTTKENLASIKEGFDMIYKSLNGAISDVLDTSSMDDLLLRLDVYKTQYSNYIFIYDQLCQAIQSARDFMVDKKVSDASQAVQKELVDLGLASEGLHGHLNAVVADNIVTEAEKKSIQKMLQQLEKEKLELDTAYDNLYTILPAGSVKDDLSRKKDEFDIWYGGLYGAIDEVLTSSGIDGLNTAMNKYNTLYNSYKKAYDVLCEALQIGRDEVVDNKIVAAEKKLQQELIDLGVAGGSVDEGLRSVVEDNIVTEAEKRSIQKVLQQLQKEKKEADTAYADLYAALGSDKNTEAQQNLKNKKTAFDTAYNTLVSAVNTVINSSTAEEVLKNLETYNTAYTNYQTYYDEYQQAINVATQIDYSAKLEITREGIMSAVSATYATADAVTKLSTTVTQVETGLTSAVTVNVDDKNFFGSILEQQYDHFLIGFNNNSRVIYFDKNGLAFYTINETRDPSAPAAPVNLPENAVIKMWQTSFWTEYYNKGFPIGRIGTGSYVGYPNYMGLVFQLKDNGSYMGWGVQQPGTDTFYLKLSYNRVGAGGEWPNEGLYLGANLYTEGWDVSGASLRSSAANGYSVINNSEIPVVTNIDVDDNGNLTWDTTKIRIRNGMVTSVPEEMVVND